MRLKLIVPLLSLGLAGCDYVDFGDVGRYQRDFHYSYPLQAGGRLQVESFNGGVEISAWDENTVDISGTKWGPTETAADAVRIDVDHSAGAVFVRAVRPVEPRHNLGARFAIKVPRTAVLDRIVTSNGRIHTLEGQGPAVIRTSNGAVRIENLRGSLNVQTSNGPVDLVETDGDATVRTSNGHIHAEGLRGTLEATTSNGSITADVAPATGGVRAHTSNGSITVRLPGQTGAHVIADTSNSSIRSDFDMRMHGEMTRRHLEGDIGNGGPLVELKTSNGAIRLVKM